MPLSFEIDTARRLVITRASGVLTAADIAEARKHIRADPAFDSAFAQYMDLREVTDIAISAERLQAIASESLFGPGIRRAFVAATEYQFGMARMFGAFSEAHYQVVRAFRDPEEAERWLQE